MSRTGLVGDCRTVVDARQIKGCHRHAHQHLPGESVVLRMDVRDGAAQLEDLVAVVETSEQPAYRFNVMLTRRLPPRAHGRKLSPPHHCTDGAQTAATSQAAPWPSGRCGGSASQTEVQLVAERLIAGVVVEPAAVPPPRSGGPCCGPLPPGALFSPRSHSRSSFRVWCTGRSVKLIATFHGRCRSGGDPTSAAPAAVAAPGWSHHCKRWSHAAGDSDTHRQVVPCRWGETMCPCLIETRSPPRWRSGSRPR